MNTPLRSWNRSYALCALGLIGNLGCGGGGAQSDAASLARMPANHRASSIQCSQAAPAGTCSVDDNCPASVDPSEGACSGDGGGCADGGSNGACLGSTWTCTRDSDCSAAGINGRCTAWLGPAGCSCTSDRCVVDGDCPSGQTCACHGAAYMFGSGNSCVPGNCRVDADCRSGAYCSPTPALPCNMGGRDLFCQGVGYYCHTPKDECADDSDCQGIGLPGCLYDPAVGYWRCEIYAQPA